jgi:hypothetical protein
LRVRLFGGRPANGGLAKLKMQANIILADVNTMVKIAASVVVPTD